MTQRTPTRHYTPADPNDSQRLAWLDHQLDVMGSLGAGTQALLAQHMARVRAEKRAILRRMP